VEEYTQAKKPIERAREKGIRSLSPCVTLNNTNKTLLRDRGREKETDVGNRKPGALIHFILDLVL
jgi:hypothetical protein